MVRHNAQDHTSPHPNQPHRQLSSLQLTKQSRTDRRGGTALLTAGLLDRIQPEEPIFLRNLVNQLRRPRRFVNNSEQFGSDLVDGGS
jgi:hypothetical protein